MDGDIVVVTQDKITYRASALGGCLTSLVAARMEYTATTPPEKLQRVYDSGHSYEQLAKDLMRQEGWTVWDEELEVVVPITSRIFVVGHIDGKVLPGAPQVGGGNRPFLGEVKSQNEEEFERFNREGWEGGRFPHYKWQVSSYMLATGLPLCLVRVKRAKNGGLSAFAVDYINEPFYSIAQIRSKVLAVESLASQGDIPQCENPAWGCPYWYLPEHGERAENDRVELPDEELDSVAREYAEASKLAKLNKDKVEALRPLLYAATTDNEKIATVSGIKVTRWEQNNPPYTDYAAMVKDGLIEQDVVEKYTRQTRGPRIRVTLPKGMGDGATNDG